MSQDVAAEKRAVPPLAEERILVATQWQLIWWRFRRHRLAVVGGIFVIAFYLIVLGADFLAYSDPVASNGDISYMPPQPIHILDAGLGMHAHPVTGKRDPTTFQKIYRADPDTKVPIRLFARGFSYKFLGLFPTNLHLIGVEGDGVRAEETIFILGTDMQGRDLYSRLLYGVRTSLTIGLIGVVVSLFLGVLLGGVSGFVGGVADVLIQRVIEIIRSIPTIPLWMGLAAALPRDWGTTEVYFAITIIISLIGWTELARVVRGRFLSLRKEDFVTAAELAGCSRIRIIFRHMVPAFMSHIIAATTLALPRMIISETSLSFLGLGLRPPAISLGVLLQQAQNIQSVALTPWLLIPTIPVMVIILAFNFLGDGLRDAADPYE